MKTIGFRCFALVNALVVAALAGAQQHPPAKEMLIGKQIFYALGPNIAKELKITDAQRKKIEDAFQGAVQVEGDKIMIMISGDMSVDDLAKDAMKVLDAPQQKRLEEIWLQESGSAAILDDKIAKDLALTREQKEKATKIAEGMAAKLMDIFQSGADDHEATAKEGKKLRTEASKQFDLLLTEEQKKKLEEMKGKVFKQEKKDGGG